MFIILCVFNKRFKTNVSNINFVQVKKYEEVLRTPVRGVLDAQRDVPLPPTQPTTSHIPSDRY